MAEVCPKCDGLMIQFKSGYHSDKNESYPYWDIYRCDCWPKDLIPKADDYIPKVTPDYPIITGAKGGVTLVKKEDADANAAGEGRR